jgi:hypothetical protein
MRGSKCPFIHFEVYKNIDFSVFLLIDSFAMFLMSYYAYKVGLRLSKNTN